MTNKKQIQTKKISFILALSVIIYAAIDTYLFLCHDINIMRITTPVILGLVIAIILCGLLHKFFYKWLTKNPINFSFGEPSTPIVESENAIESIDATEILTIEQPMDLPEQESFPSQLSNPNTFPYELVNATLEYLRLNLRDNVPSQIPIDVPDKGDYRFHLDVDNDDSQ